MKKENVFIIFRQNNLEENVDERSEAKFSDYTPERQRRSTSITRSNKAPSLTLRSLIRKLRLAFGNYVFLHTTSYRTSKSRK